MRKGSCRPPINRDVDRLREAAPLRRRPAVRNPLWGSCPAARSACIENAGMVSSRSINLGGKDAAADVVEIRVAAMDVSQAGRTRLKEFRVRLQPPLWRACPERSALRGRWPGRGQSQQPASRPDRCRSSSNHIDSNRARRAGLNKIDHLGQLVPGPRATGPCARCSVRRSSTISVGLDGFSSPASRSVKSYALELRCEK